MKKIFSLIFITFLSFGINSIAFADDDGKKLFVNLISDDLDRAAMAVSISKKVLSTEDIEGTIFLSAQGVRWVDKTIPQNKSSGTSAGGGGGGDVGGTTSGPSKKSSSAGVKKKGVSELVPGTYRGLWPRWSA